MKNLIPVLFITLLLSCVDAFSSSLDLDNDAKSSQIYSQAEEFNFGVQSKSDLRVKLDKAMTNLIFTTMGELRKQGFHYLADQIEYDWNTKYHGFILRYGGASSLDVGDHEAIQWLLSIHDPIHKAIGDVACRALRIHDIWKIAYMVPVVFRCVDNVDKIEYALHFIPLMGIASYWVSYGVCVGASMGSGVVMACGLIGMGVEQLVVRFIAPPLSPKAWERACVE